MSKEFTAIYKQIQQAKSIIILTHENPDGDALGSAFVFSLILLKLKKKHIVSFSKFNQEKWKFNPYLPKIPIGIPKKQDSFNLAIILDASNPKRLGNCESFIEKADYIINIDHHLDNTLFGDINLICDKAATGKILFSLMKNWSFSLNKEIAYNILLSIISDTGRFLFSNTDRIIFKTVYELLEYTPEEDYHELVKEIYDQQPLKKIKYQQKMFENLEIIEDKIAFSYLDHDEDYDLIDILRTLEGMDGAILVRKVANNIKISFRSKNKNMNSRALATNFGGGGHIQAAGAKIKLTDFKKQLKEIKKIICQSLKNET